MCEICNTPTSRESDGYKEFEQSIIQKFNESIQDNAPIFTTTADGLYEAYLDHLPAGRQHYTCAACKSFIERYGGLVTISEDGRIDPVMWDLSRTPEFFCGSVEAIIQLISRSKVNGVFLTKNPILGTPITGEWTHMSVTIPDSMLYKEKGKTVGEMTAEKKADFAILINGLREYPIEAVDRAVTLLKTDSLYRSEKVLGIAEWLQNLHEWLAINKNNKMKSNHIWKAVATAPPGFVHIKSSMIGTLLDDIVAGLPFDDVSRRFAAKMHPLQYQRPQAAPSSGNIERAEKIVEKLGIKESLERRFARLEEIQTIWKPSEEVEVKQGGPGVFGHLKAKDKVQIPNMELPTKTVTWKKFFETVLPTAKSIEFYVDPVENLSAVLTAQHKDAPPIIQWDQEESRNPFSSYVYHGGSTPNFWNIHSGYNKVTGICYDPSSWQEGYKHQGNWVLFILEGAKDERYRTSGNALFPEILKNELREVRYTIEAYSRSAEILGYAEASACGVRLSQGSTWSAKVRVISDSGVANYMLDRWD